MDFRANWLLDGFHAAADVAVATAAGLIAMLVCYPIYIVAAIVKVPLKGFNRWSESEGVSERREWRRSKARPRST